MKTIILSICFIAMLFVCSAQPIPNDSLYLGQTPPGETPKKFNLSASSGFATVERIAISNDGKTIIYHENNGYNNNSIGRIKYYSFINNKWEGASVLFDSYTSPAFSLTNDTLYLEKNCYLWYSVKDNNRWTDPKIFELGISYWHYCQFTNSGTLYASLKNQNKERKKEWSSIVINKNDTIIKSLGKPINSPEDNLDFYISRDESYIIFASDRTDLVKYGYSDLFISFRKKDGTWSMPQNLGKEINISTEARWGPYVSSDNKYLFYSRSSTQDNSDACTYWMRIDNLVDRLRGNAIVETK